MEKRRLESETGEGSVVTVYRAAVDAYYDAITAAAWRFSISSDSAEDIADAALSACSAEEVKCRTAVRDYWDRNAAPAYRAGNTSRLISAIIDTAKMHAKRVVVERRTQNADKPTTPPAPPEPHADYGRS
jgi:hypothetical protein